MNIAGVTVNFTAAESLVYDGRGGNDLVTINVPAASSTTYTPGAAVDASSLQIDSLVPLGLQNFGNGGQPISIVAAGAASLVYQGTNTNDLFVVTGLTGPTRAE